jgi:integrase
MKKASVKTIFNRKKKLDKNNQAPVVIEIYFPATKERKFINTGYKFEPKYWDADNNKIRRSFKHWVTFEQTINNIIRKIEKYEYALIEKEQHLLPEHIELIFSDKAKLTYFIDFYEATMLDEKHLKRGTTKEHRYTLNLLTEFAPKQTLDKVDYLFAKSFDAFMRNSKGLKQNTIHKHHQHVRRFFLEAKRQGIAIDIANPYSEFKSSKEKSDRIALTEVQLKQIEKCDIPEDAPSLNEIKDMFLFSCYTGLRYSDISTLHSKDIFIQNGTTYIRKRMEKVSKDVVLNISVLFNGKALAILNKYNTSGLVFPQYTNQFLNRELKVLAMGSKINTNLTFHIARHTFGTMLAEKTQNPYLIMELMGHADIKTSMIYIHYSLERIDMQLKEVNW